MFHLVMKTLFFASLITPTFASQIYNFKKGEMLFQYEIIGDEIQILLRAPTHGWLAIGFNSNNDINLADLAIMKVENGLAEIDDQYVIEAPKHVSDTTLGGTNDLMVIGYTQNTNYTEVRFRRKLSPKDRWNRKLTLNQEIWVILAYSESKDFQHHSRMREHFKITLKP